MSQDGIRMRQNPHTGRTDYRKLYLIQRLGADGQTQYASSIGLIHTQSHVTVVGLRLTTIGQSIITGKHVERSIERNVSRPSAGLNNEQQLTNWAFRHLLPAPCPLVNQ
jgi:hypothetical protein